MRREAEAGSSRIVREASSLQFFVEWLLALALLIACCALSISNGRIQKFIFNSDQLVIPSFVEDFLHNPHFTPFTWMIPPAPYAFPDLPAFLMVRLVVGNAYAAVMIYAVLYVVAIAFASKLIFDRAFANRAAARLATLAFLALSAMALALSSAVPAGSILYQPFIPHCARYRRGKRTCYVLRL